MVSHWDIVDGTPLGLADRLLHRRDVDAEDGEPLPQWRLSAIMRGSAWIAGSAQAQANCDCRDHCVEVPVVHAS
jgi:hypothetical protein